MNIEARNSRALVTLKDLEFAYNELSASGMSPVSVRRAFTRFVDLTQKLTSVMRKEYKQLAGESWIASEFQGWCAHTEVFKKIRNADQHQNPIQIQVKERKLYAITEDKDKFIAVECVWELDDQLANKPPDGMFLMPTNPETGGPNKSVRYTPSKVEYEFLLYPETTEIIDLLGSLGTRNILSLSKSCYEILCDYYGYYEVKISNYPDSILNQESKGESP
ncbi:hypothetical protein [Sedimenticola selenatireducens]|uniref:Uncharacterized protein n=1 Tax=Sedimenticola selenatireducens TaxID=191960 RepID=A0A2N6CYF3_9GAMM|nr:hypothetical protein [Sedimenticola selenatireducens]PLX62352.1 MAG: hypothetical protein C0630_05700 [Sedimenticola selenatireducens]